MAQKAAKTTAVRNASTLRRTHLTTLCIHAFYLLLRLLLYPHRTTRTSLLAYVLLSAPALGIEVLFDVNSRPKYNETGLVRAGEDLEAKGLTEWMWDVLYWTWGCVGMAAVVGDWAWWAYMAVPLYSAWLAYSTFGNVKQMFGAGGGGGEIGQGASSGAGSKRQQKMEKRGGQKMQYR